MNKYYEIAYAAASERLCLFTGTGFSKAVTNNEAPSWQGLLESVCDSTPNSAALKKALFPATGERLLSLDEAAQVIAIELTKANKSIHAEIAEKIRALTLKGNNKAIQEFLSTRVVEVVTTNYDKLIEVLSGAQDCHSLTPGLPIPRSKSRIKIYHVHGSVDSPDNMVVTSDDYFHFMNSETYFSKKLSTVLHENTVVIIGYSLGDTNLKTIISDYKEFSRNHSIGSNIFLISRSKIDQHIKDYYAHCYGIRVMDKVEVHEFFDYLNKALPEADKRFKRSINNIQKVVLEDGNFKDEYLRIENSFFEIVSSLAAIGISINDDRVVRTLGNIVKAKIGFTGESGAWDQYTQLSRWLAYLASILELRNTSIEKVFLDATLKSMTTMRKDNYTGYSWQAYKSWSNQWSGVLASNRVLIRKHIEANTTWSDALSVVRSI